MAKTKSFFNTIWQRKFTFLFVYFLVFLFTYLLLVAIDFLPEPKSGPETESNENLATVVEAEAIEQELLTTESVETVESVDEIVVATHEKVLPTEIFIERLDKTIEVLNPASRTIADLDEALLSGVVRHPDSAHLTQQGNVFILGHSSYLPNVFNENYQAFNGIQNLEWGDTIEVSSGDEVFVYRVEKVFQASAQEVTVPINVEQRMLTLATCNSFGSVDDRYIVEALLVESKEA